MGEPKEKRDGERERERERERGITQTCSYKDDVELGLLGYFW